MSTFYNKLSPATRLLIQSLLAVLGSVLSGVATAAYQSYTQAGHLNLQMLVNVCLLTFALLFGKAMHDWVPAHAQQIIQSGKDNEARLFDALQRAQAVKSPQNLPAVVPVLVQAPATLTADHLQSIAAQLAVNLINIASNKASQTTAANTPPPAPVAPSVPAPYVDPLRNSAVLPAYTPPLADQATQSVPSQVPFTL